MHPRNKKVFLVMIPVIFGQNRLLSLDLHPKQTYTQIYLTKLDSHANMVVVEKKACIIQLSGESADVCPFSNECSNMEKVPIIDATLAYDCKTTMKTCLLIVRNALYTPSMENNLIHTFIMCEAGIFVSDVASINCGEDMSHDIHSIIITEEDIELQITPRLDGILSYFPT